MKGCLPGQWLCNERNCRCSVFDNALSFEARVISVRVFGKALVVVKSGFSAIMGWPLGMLKRATRPLPLPSIDLMLKSGIPQMLLI